MCTAIFKKTNKSYLGRNLDIEYSLNENFIITPRNYPIKFKKHNTINNHFAIFGIGTIIDDYPLYIDCANEFGLGIVSLSFKNSIYYKEDKNKINIAIYEINLYLLSTCKTINDVKDKLLNINIINKNFNNNIKSTPLHFLISDLNKSIVVETTIDGLKIYDNPFNVLTNEPSFLYHIENIKQYVNLSIKNPQNNIINKNLKYEYSNYGLIGLPGDYSSPSRFIKSLILLNNVILKENELNQLFYCLDAVKMIKGLIVTNLGYEYTKYSSVINLNENIYYYKTYENPTIKSYKLSDFNTNENTLIKKELI